MGRHENHRVLRLRQKRVIELKPKVSTTDCATGPIALRSRVLRKLGEHRPAGPVPVEPELARFVLSVLVLSVLVPSVLGLSLIASAALGLSVPGSVGLVPSAAALIGLGLFGFAPAALGLAVPRSKHAALRMLRLVVAECLEPIETRTLGSQSGRG